jgi:hypothetical protein
LNEVCDAEGDEEFMCSRWRCESRGVDTAVGRRLPASRPMEEMVVWDGFWG